MKSTRTDLDLSPAVRRLLRQVRGLNAIQPSVATPAIPRLAYDGRLTLLAGREGSGKSTLLRAAIAAATRGQDWLDPAQQIPPVRVLWVGEERPEDIRAEFDPFDVDTSLVDVVSIDDVPDAADLQAALPVLDTRVVIIDPVADLLRLTDERSYSAVRASLRQLSPRASDTSIIGILHSHRDRDLRDTVSTYYGSVGFGSACDLLLDLKPVKDNETQRILQVSKSRSRAAQRQGERYVLEFDGVSFTRVQPRLTMPTFNENDVRSFREANPDATKKDAAKFFNVRPGGSAAYAAFSRMWSETA